MDFEAVTHPAGRGAETHLDPGGDELFAHIAGYMSPDDVVRVRLAHDYAASNHGQQRRISGELYITHPLSVAHNLAEYRLDAPTIMAAILHDIAEDTTVSIAELEKLFDSEVSSLVDGVTKLKEIASGMAQEGRLDDQAIRDASLHKMFGAMTDDVRVVLVKLFDRLHNMRTISALPISKQQEKATETLNIFAPLANRLGMWRMKSELESLSLQVLNPEAHRIISHTLESNLLQLQSRYDEVSRKIMICMREAEISVVRLIPSPTSIYSTYQAIVSAGASYDRIDNHLRIAVLLENTDSCYRALGRVHELWRPVPGKFDDYIAAPRENLYRALHTTVVDPEGQLLKVRFRTVAMNELSEIGILAKWLYTGTPLWDKGVAFRVDGLFRNIRQGIDLEPQNISRSVQSVVDDMFGEQVIVYTPRGDLVELPQGSTAIDFAYAIHTEVGNQCQSALVNRQNFPLNRPLRDGDSVYIFKSRTARPHRTWLDEDLGFTATSSARSKIRRWFKKRSADEARRLGMKLLDEELTMLDMTDLTHLYVANQLRYHDQSQLYDDLGRAELLPTDLAANLLSIDWKVGPTYNPGQLVEDAEGVRFTITSAGNRKLSLCRICNPKPPDPIVGFLRADGGATVHQDGCHALRPDPLADRTLILGWGRGDSLEARRVSLMIEVFDRTGLLLEIARLMESQQINITSIHTVEKAKESNLLGLSLEMEVFRPRQLVRVLHRAQALPNVHTIRILN